MNKSEENYSTIEKELLATYWATKYFRPYLFGKKIILYTDHKPLTSAVNLKDPSGKIGRWMIALLDYSYDKRYRAGKQNLHELNINEEENDSSSDAASQHSAAASEFIPCTEKPVNAFSNQIILKTDSNESELLKDEFWRTNNFMTFQRIHRHQESKLHLLP